MPEFEWDDEASHLARTAFAAHRGAVPWRCLGISAIFGNDGYSTDARARSEVEHVRSRLARAGVEALGFGVSDGGCSWALLVKSDDLDRLIELVWEGWRLACDPAVAGGRRGPAVGGPKLEAVQRSIAADAVILSGDDGPGRPSLN